MWCGVLPIRGLGEEGRKEGRYVLKMIDDFRGVGVCRERERRVEEGGREGGRDGGMGG